jgi:hypothetical protein
MLLEFSIYDVIDKIRPRPGMYIGDSSPNSLFVFLEGYRMAMSEAGVPEASDPPLIGFHDWVASKFGFYESTPGWANMILAATIGLGPANVPSQVGWEDIDQSASWQQKVEATVRVFALIDEYRCDAAKL